MGSTAHFVSPLKLGDSVSFETSSNVLSRWRRRARVFAPCSVDSTANFSLCRGINAQDRLQFSPALVNVIVPAIGSISEIEKPCIRRRHILAMAGSLSLSSVVCRAGHALPLSKICLQIHGVLYPASVVTACTFGEYSIRHLKNASNAALSWMLPSVTSASIRACRKWYAPRTTFRRRCPALDVLTTTRRWKLLGHLKTECLYRPASPRAPRWNSSLSSTSISIILNVSRPKNGLTLPEIRGWTV